MSDREDFERWWAQLNPYRPMDLTEAHELAWRAFRAARARPFGEKRVQIAEPAAAPERE